MKDVEQRLAKVEKQNEDLSSRLAAQEEMSVIDLLFLHPFKHMTKPGIKNKVEGGVGLVGRGAIGYGTYRGVVWLISKLAG